ncbi:MAG: methionine--tRNA ligase subunit beta, partial [candidate division Zixibacteria bacterium]|nr:methionine--tRNA ligase subunit beta [candidate division Zixibacteria bacterium]
VDEFGADGTRYLLLTQYPFGVDGDIQAKRFVTQYNSDLANDLGNLVSRVAKMMVANCDGKIPQPVKEIVGLDRLMDLMEELPNTVYAHIQHLRIGHAIADVMTVVRATNKFFNDCAPWKLVKEGKADEMGGILYASAEVIRIVSILLFPLMPNKMRQVRAVFGLDDSTLTLDSAREFFVLTPGTSVTIDEAVFPRLKPKSDKKTETIAEAAAVDEANLLDISEFARAELRVAEVIEAERVEGADKLLRLQINIGSEKRQIVAGVAQHYPPDRIKGMKIVVVTNLKPATIRGVESRGMLLAAKAGKKLTLLTPDDDLPPGAKIS